MASEIVKEFEKKLRKAALGPGAQWLKADFHVHLPTSHDYKYVGTDAYERLGKALDATGRRFVLLLKHEAFATKAELALLQPHCPSVTLIPAAEINVFVDALFKKAGKDYYFHCIVGSDPDDSDEYGHVLRAAKDKFQHRDGPYPSGFTSSVVDVAEHFRAAGALFIPAHLHQAKSPAESRSIDDLYDDDTFLDFVRRGTFDALEVRQESTAAFFDGSHKTTAGLRIPHITCVRSSDAHHHDSVGQRATWIRAEKASFGELKAALALPHRVSLSEPTDAHARIIGLHVVGTFIPDTWICLNSGLNALIGGKGSGKTAILECLRFVLNTPVPPERAEDVSKHRQHILGSGGFVECLVQDAAGQKRVISRRADSPDRISVTPQSGDTMVLAASAGQAFPISILGWHEIESVADRASARIGILDRVGDPAAIIKAQGDIADSVAQARDALPMLQRQARRLDKKLEELWGLKKKRSTLARLAEGQLSSLQESYDWFLKAEERTKDIEANAVARGTAVPDVIPSRLDTTIQNCPSSVAAEDLTKSLSDLEQCAHALKDAELESTTAISSKLGSLAAQAKVSAVEITKSFRQFRDEVYAPAVARLSPEERDILTRQIQVLEETKRLPSVQAACEAELGELRSLATQLHGQCSRVCELRDQIANSRSELVDTLNKELLGVRLNFRRAANTESRSRFQGKYPNDGASLTSYVDKFTGRDAYERLRNLFDKLRELDIDENKWVVESHLLDAKFVDLLDVLDDDDVGVALEVGRRGYVEIQSLSAGQRCVAVFPLLLRNSRGPLVIDQPEDNLDNRYIADSISPDLLTKKLRQQYLVTSHNANLVVLTDADLIVHVDSDGTHAEFPAAGYLAWEGSTVKNSVLQVLDGGEAALLARQKKYGIRTS